MGSTKEEEELIHKILDKLDQMKNKMKVNFDQVNQRFDSIDEKLNLIENKLSKKQ